jgi:hypothetical protein
MSRETRGNSGVRWGGAAVFDSEARLVRHAVPARVDCSALVDVRGVVHARVFRDASVFHVVISASVAKRTVKLCGEMKEKRGRNTCHPCSCRQRWHS